MLQVLVVEFHIHDEHVDAFAEAIGLNARTSLSDEPGCLRFDVCRDPADAACFYLYELYEDEAAVQAHLRAPHFLSMDRQTAGWVASKAVRRLTLEGRA